VLSIQADPRSPEHGQYGFLQDLVRHVAYETLSKRERRLRHLAAAGHLEAAFPDDEEIVEVLASHYLEAYRAAPDADDAPEIKRRARETLARAGERAGSLGANSEAQRYFERAAELTDEGRIRAQPVERAGQMAWRGGDAETADALFETSIADYEAEGATHAAARVSGRLADVERQSGRLDDALERMERAFAVVSTDEADEDLAELAERLATAQWFAGNTELASERVEHALEIAESLRLPTVLARGFMTKALIAETRGRPEEELALLNHALKLALEHDLPDEVRRAYFNLSDFSLQRDRYADALEFLEGARAPARTTGDRLAEWSVLSETTYPLYMLGRWDESLAAFAEIPEEQIRTAGFFLSALTSVVEIHVHRGDVEEARRILGLYARLETSGDLQDQGGYAGGWATVHAGERRYGDALEAGLEAVEAGRIMGLGFQHVKQGYVHAAEAALALGEAAKVDDLLAFVDARPPGLRPPYLDAQSRRLKARMSGDPAGYTAAAAHFRELAMPFWLAVTLTEHGEWLVSTGSSAEAEPLLAEAREIFERLEARPWLERAARVVPVSDRATSSAR
jgi:tetratricopeptide (TPR) repeat protein